MPESVPKYTCQVVLTKVQISPCASAEGRSSGELTILSSGTRLWASTSSGCQQFLEETEFRKLASVPSIVHNSPSLWRAPSPGSICPPCPPP